MRFIVFVKEPENAGITVEYFLEPLPQYTTKTARYARGIVRTYRKEGKWSELRAVELATGRERVIF